MASCSRARRLCQEYGKLDSDYVFVNLRGGRVGSPLTYAAVYDLVRRLRVHTGIDFDPHWLRHTYATGLLPRCAGRGRLLPAGARVGGHDLGYVRAPDRGRHPVRACPGRGTDRGRVVTSAFVLPLGTRRGGEAEWTMRVRGALRPEFTAGKLVVDASCTGRVLQVRAE